MKLTEKEKNRKLNDLLDALEFNQVSFVCDVGSLSKVKKLPSYLYFGTVVESDMKGSLPFPAHISAQIYGDPPKPHNQVINTIPQNSSCRNFTRISCLQRLRDLFVHLCGQVVIFVKSVQRAVALDKLLALRLSGMEIMGSCCHGTPPYLQSSFACVSRWNATSLPSLSTLAFSRMSGLRGGF